MGRSAEPLRRACPEPVVPGEGWRHTGTWPGGEPAVSGRRFSALLAPCRSGGVGVR